MNTKRYIIARNGDERFLLDMKDRKVYQIEDKSAFLIQPTVDMWLKFCPYVEEIASYDKPPFKLAR